MHIIERNNHKIAVAETEYVHTVEDVLDLMANAQYHGRANTIVVYKENLHSDFFDLKTRFAGEVLQKFSNYHVRLAIIGDFSEFTSKALHDFIYECNKGSHVLWTHSLDAALDTLSK